MTAGGERQTGAGRGPSNPWLWPLIAALVLHGASSFMMRLVPTLAPALMEDLGWSEAFIGYLAAINGVGVVAFLAAGNPLIRVLGSVRAMQAGLGIGILGVLLLLTPFALPALLASMLIGVGHGPSNPAGNDVLQRFAPRRYMGLIFSLKQAGVLFGGVAAGLLLPVVADAFGWRGAVIFAALMGLGIVLAFQPLRRRIDLTQERSPSPPLRSYLSAANLTRPVRSLAGDRDLARLGFVGACLALGQGTWFAYHTTYLVVALELSLTVAGALFALMQVCGIVARVIVGWTADRLGSVRGPFRVVALCAAVTTGLMGFAEADWPFWSIVLLSAAGGATVAGWNGIHIAGVVRIAPPALIHEISSGITLLVFVGAILGPILFSVAVVATGAFHLGFFVVAALMLPALPVLLRLGRR